MTGINGWQFWVDRGGTFTDIVALAPDGTIEAVRLGTRSLWNPASFPSLMFAIYVVLTT